MRALGIGIGIPWRRGGVNWEAYWATRTPTDIVMTILTDTSVKVDWTDAAEGADGLKVYFNDVLKDTVAFGVGTSTITVVLNTEYTIKVVAYKDTNESDPLTGNLTWSHWMQYSYTDKINTHVTWTSAQKALILGRLQEDYVVTTFGPAGTDETACDFFMFMETIAGLKTTRTVTKTGATLRWNYGDGNIYSQNNIPGQIATDVITVTSTDGFSGITYWICSANFTGNIPNLPYYFTGALTQIYWVGAATIGSPYRLKGNITNWGTWLNSKTALIGFGLNENDITGDLTGWTLNDKVWNLDLSGCPGLYGSTPAIPATWSGTGNPTFQFDSCGFTGIGGTNFIHTKVFVLKLENNYFSSSVIETFVDNLNTYYTANAPQQNFTLTINGTYNGSLVNGEADVGLAGVNTAFTNAGKTFTDTFNAFTYLLTPLDNPTLVLSMDDDPITDYTIILPLLNARSKVGTSYRYDEWIVGHQTITEVNALIAAGWSIEAHPGFDVGMDEAAIRAEMIAHQTFFTNNSIPMFNHCSYQAGYFNALIKSIMPDYVSTGRATMHWDATATTTNRGGLIYKDSDAFELYGIYSDYGEEDTEGLKFKIDQAKKKTAGIIIYIHSVTTEQAATIMEVIDYAISQGFDVVSIDGLYAKMTA